MSTVGNGLYQNTMILVGALSLEEGNESPFTVEKLAMATWKLFPKEFGMTDCEDLHPCTYKVYKNLTGKGGLLSKGLLSKTENTLKLTPEGRCKGYDVAGKLKIKLRRSCCLLPLLNQPVEEHTAFLDRTVDSAVMWKIKSGQGTLVEFQEAINFWGMELSCPNIKETRLQFIRTLEDIRYVMAGSRELVLPNGRSISMEDLSHVEQADQMLYKRFERHLKILHSNKVG